MSTMHEASTPQIKLESGSSLANNEDSLLRSDQGFADASAAGLSDADIYEDAGDLDFAKAAQAAYLTRIPKFLWENWSKIEDDQEIVLGIVRVEGTVSDVKRMSLLLSSDLAVNANVAKEYNMHVMNSTPSNMYMFSEKDLPGFTSKNRGSTRYGQFNGRSHQGPPRPDFQERSKQASQGLEGDNGKRWKPYYKKAVPKQTAIAGKVQMEINCLPVENDEYRSIMTHRNEQALKPKKETKFIDGVITSNVLHPGTMGGGFDDFIKITGTTKGRPQDIKAARIPQNELLDLIHDCFKKYNYWSLKSLKAAVKQPEAYLRQTLEMVAHLVRQGPHAMTWQLKPEAKFSAYADTGTLEKAKDEVAPDAGQTYYGIDGASDAGNMGEGSVSGDDDDNVKMEDVLM